MKQSAQLAAVAGFMCCFRSCCAAARKLSANIWQAAWCSPVKPGTFSGCCPSSRRYVASGTHSRCRQLRRSGRAYSSWARCCPRLGSLWSSGTQSTHRAGICYCRHRQPVWRAPGKRQCHATRIVSPCACQLPMTKDGVLDAGCRTDKTPRRLLGPYW